MNRRRTARDPTVGMEFDMPIFTWRWGHADVYKLTRTDSGWIVTFLDVHGPCDKGGRPLLYESLRHDGIDYPADLPGWLEHLWDVARERRLPARRLQTAIRAVANWVSEVEFRKPKGSIWSAYKDSVFMPKRRPRAADGARRRTTG